VNERACVDVIKVGEQFFASLWIYDTQHTVGPADDCAALNKMVIETLSDLRTVAGIKDLQDLELQDLQHCLNTMCAI